MTVTEQPRSPTIGQLKELYRTSNDADVVRACLVALGDAHYVLGGAPSDAECDAAERTCIAALAACATSSDPKNTVPIADVAHVVRDALVPAQVQLGLLQIDLEHDLDEERTRRFKVAEDAINTALAYVDGLVKRAQSEGR